jgi:hypothetical protein
VPRDRILIIAKDEDLNPPRIWGDGDIAVLRIPFEALVDLASLRWSPEQVADLTGWLWRWLAASAWNTGVIIDDDLPPVSDRCDPLGACDLQAVSTFLLMRIRRQIDLAHDKRRKLPRKSSRSRRQRRASASGNTTRRHAPLR